MSSRPIKYRGPTWNAARKLIKVEFDEVGLLNTCEVHYEGLCDGQHFTFAHSLRRNFIEFREQMEEVVRACQKCHAKLDAQEHIDTYNEVREIIANRVTPVKSIFEKRTK